MDLCSTKINVESSLGANQGKYVSISCGPAKGSKASSKYLMLYVCSSISLITFVQVVRAIQRHLDGCLGIGVLCLQRFYGFS